MQPSFANTFPASKPFFDWCHATWIGEFMREDTWQFAITETVHLLALAVLLGSILLVNLRLLGILRGWTVVRLARTLAPFITGGLIGMLTTGALLFVSEPIKYFNNDAFLPKMVFLTAAILYHYTVYRKAGAAPALLGKAAALVSIALWFSIGVAGRAIGFV
jgi:hypothetical protein